jgi:hypothetical protein
VCLWFLTGKRIAGSAPEGPPVGCARLALVPSMRLRVGFSTAFDGTPIAAIIPHRVQRRVHADLDQPFGPRTRRDVGVLDRNDGLLNLLVVGRPFGFCLVEFDLFVVDLLLGGRSAPIPKVGSMPGLGAAGRECRSGKGRA